MRALARCALVALVLVGCVGCDQGSKAAARQYLPGTAVHSYLGDPLRLQYAVNPGAFLSLGDSLASALCASRLRPAQRVAIAAMGAGGMSPTPF